MYSCGSQEADQAPSEGEWRLMSSIPDGKDSDTKLMLEGRVEAELASWREGASG